MRKIEFKLNEEIDIILKYKNNWSLQKIGDFYSVSKEVIKKVLLKHNIQLRKRTHIYKCDYDFFEKIDSAEKAYWLGFLAADGCNYSRPQNASIIINIHQKDIEMLEKFQKICKTDAKIITYTTSAGYSNNTPMCKIVLNSKKMSSDLSDKGIVPNKSLTLKQPNISEKYYLPFILGYFDGDGSIYKTNQYNNYNLSLQGTKEFLTWVNQVLNLNLPLEKRRQDNKNSYYIRCGGTKKPYYILKQLYNSVDTHLDRKYNIFKDLETVVFSRNTKRLSDRELLENPKAF